MEVVLGNSSKEKNPGESPQGLEENGSQCQEACGQSEQFEFLGGRSNWKILSKGMTAKVSHIV